MSDILGNFSGARSITIIEEVYNSKNSLERFEVELERALEEKFEVIVIEPSRLGDETGRWIAVGNCLHRTAYLSGLAALASASIWTDKPYICTPFSCLSILCTGVYALAWHCDPCVHYQVQTKLDRLLPKYPELNNLQLNDSMSPVVIVRRNNNRRTLMHSSVTLVAALVCMWRVWESMK